MNKFILDIRSPIQNERGDALALAMIVLVISLISSLVMIELSRQVETNSVRPRVKSMMSATEAKVRQQLMSPTSYTCTGAARTNCTLRNADITSLRRSLPGTPCPPSIPNCGIDVSVVSYEQSVTVAGATASRATVKIHYEGTNFSLRDIIVAMVIPPDVLKQNGIFMCPNLRAPKFKGFLANGELDCHALPDDVGVGQYVKKVNLNNLTLEVADLPNAVSCSSEQLVRHVDWGFGGSAFTATCGARANPFTEFAFTPGAPPLAPTYTVNPD